jgi:uncharacterized phage protein (TIGR01671 family)
MSREIKFRAFDTKGDGMFYDIQNGITFDDGSKYTFDRFLNPDANDSHEWIVMQFTGLKDKNGNDIYEGDIIKFRVDFPESEFDNGVVRFAAGGYWTSQTEDDLEELLSEELKDLDGEVIGNIYEHPHLLKQPSIL